MSEIRKGVLADLAAIQDIYNYYVLNSSATFDTKPVVFDEKWFAKFNEENPLFVACDEGLKVIGYAYYGPFRDRPAYNSTKETTIYVSHSSQKSGVGSLLYKTLIEYAIIQKVHVLLAVVGGNNPQSVALHGKFGFTFCGQMREVGYKFDTWQDIFFYQRVLS